MKKSVRVLIGTAIGVVLAGGFGLLSGAQLSEIAPTIAILAGFGALVGYGAGVLAGDKPQSGDDGRTDVGDTVSLKGGQLHDRPASDHGD